MTKVAKSVCFAVILPVMRHKVITNSTSKRVQEIELFFIVCTCNCVNLTCYVTIDNEQKTRNYFS